jgi:prepilin-type N-terminal cleavage/methylation domain-containing protein
MIKNIKPGLFKLNNSGFTLIELAIIVVVLGVLASVGIPRITGMIESSRTTATEEEMRRLKIALVGSATDNLRGYETDVGSLPSSLNGLVTKPGGVADWDRFTSTGWNGPYIDSNNNDYLKDAWDVSYLYDNGARTLKSVGSGDTITITF